MCPKVDFLFKSNGFHPVDRRKAIDRAMGTFRLFWNCSVPFRSKTRAFSKIIPFALFLFNSSILVSFGLFLVEEPSIPFLVFLVKERFHARSVLSQERFYPLSLKRGCSICKFTKKIIHFQNQYFNNIKKILLVHP